MTCPQCGAEMTQRERAGVSLAQCPSCEGLFLRGVDRGMLIELENEWHVSSGPSTQPIPRITAGMAAPSMAMQTHEARAFLDELFG
jgi:Zn-finger nucleic acid-binding protein